MIDEDKEVRVFVSKMGPKTTDGKDNPLTSTQPANKNQTTDNLLELEVCKSSWITQLLLKDYQMHSTVRDYIVNSDRIKSLLKNYGKKIT